MVNEPRTPTIEALLRDLEVTPTPAEPPPVQPGLPRARMRTVLVASVLSGLLGGTVGAVAVAVRDTPAVGVARVATPPASGADLTGVAAVARDVMPSIVRVDVQGSGRFGRAASGTGSGVIFTDDGHILTNAHVVQGGGTIEVTLSTGERLAARLVGTAEPTDDIAVIKVERSGLPAATLGSTATLNVGDLAVAIGSPFGLQGSVTSGVISALHRNIDLGGGEALTDAIQTDAPINPGNSGGALANARGEVVGINTAILGSGAGNVGVGFAIPIDIARRDAEQIIETGRAERAFLGISGENVPGGALIQDVVAGGPAADAGLRAGDTIVAIDGEAIASMDALIARLSTLDPGRTVVISSLRGGRERTARATLSARPAG